MVCRNIRKNVDQTLQRIDQNETVRFPKLKANYVGLNKNGDVCDLILPVDHIGILFESNSPEIFYSAPSVAAKSLVSSLIYVLLS